MSTEEIYQNIIEEAESLEQELIKLRREFHQYPEPGWMEMRTSARIAELLESYGCDQVLMGTEVCKADARMGVPEESLLEQHYKEVNALGQVSEEKLKKTRDCFGKGVRTGIRESGAGIPVRYRCSSGDRVREHGSFSEKAGIPVNMSRLYACLRT